MSRQSWPTFFRTAESHKAFRELLLVDEHRTRKRDYELETLEQFDSLARHLEQGAGLTMPEVSV